MTFKIDLGRFSSVGGMLAFLVAGGFVKGRPILALAIGLGVFAFTWHVVRHRTPLGNAATAILLAIAAAYPLVFYNNAGVAGYYHGGMVVASLGVAYGFVRDRLSSWSLALLLVFLAYYILLYFNFGGPEGIFIGSRNRVSTLFVSLGVFLFALRQSRYDLLTALAIFAVCVSASGSSGIISSGVLLLVVLGRTVVGWKGTAAVSKVFVLLAGACAVVAIGILGPRFLGEEAQQKLRMERLAGDDVRYQIIRTYAQDHLRGADLIMGVPLEYSFVVEDNNQDSLYLNNLHNSYLDLHSKTGIFSLVIVAVILFRLVGLLRRAPYVAGLLVVVLIRAFSDTVFILGGTYNFAFYVFFLPYELILPAHVSLRAPDAVPRRRLVRGLNRPSSVSA